MREWVEKYTKKLEAKMETKVGLCKRVAHFTLSQGIVKDENTVEPTHCPDLSF